MAEALDGLEAEGLHVDALRVRGFPFADEIIEFVRAHDYVFVVEQNRDAQLRSLLTVEGNIDPARQTHRRAALRRHADHGTVHQEYNLEAARRRQCHAAAQGGVMTYLAKPKLHHPQLPTNKLGYTRRDLRP
jgi:hypothetical protein